ncbi:MAG: TolC family protein [Sedimentisphaerales bacterium]|nr:TolC family protein [Sedimentisphaerales bacterium]
MSIKNYVSMLCGAVLLVESCCVIPCLSADPNTPDPNTLTVDIERAILLAMENNRALFVMKLNPEIIETFEAQQRAVFDTTLAGEVSSSRAVQDRLARAGSGIENQIVDSVNGALLLSKLFPTGTSVQLGATSRYTDSSLYGDTFVSNRVGLTVTQALLRGMSVKANTARIEQAKIDALITEYELRAFTELLVEEVETRFWNYALSQKQIEIYTNSLALAEQQMAETQERITVGTLGETELAAAKAEVALRRENLINARSDLAQERLNLLRVMNPSDSVDWDCNVVLEYQATLPDVTLTDVEQHVAVALRLRPDLNQARLLIQSGELEVVRTRNGLLPRLDVFIDYGKSGYANVFGRAVSDLGRGSYDVTTGLAFEYPPSNRSARAQYHRAAVSRQQLRLALENLIQLAQVDVRSAYIEVNRTRQQIAATTATRESQEENLRAETEKFKVGRSTSLLVAQVQRDLVASQIAETEAVANYLKALVALYRLEGSLLHRRGIAAPGAEPVTGPGLP